MLGAVRSAGARSARGVTISARCGAPCSPATISTRRAPGRATRLAGPRSRTCGATASCCRCSTARTPVTLGEGFTPLVPRARARRHARPRSSLHQGRVAQPDQLVQGARPVGGDHARASISARRRSRCRRPATPATRQRPTPPRPACACEVFIPKDAKRPFVDECRLYGANVTLVDGLITDAGRIARRNGGPLGWYDVSTLKEPYRIEGKKTMAYELRRADGLGVAGLDHLSDRRRHRHGRHVEGVRRDRAHRLGRTGAGGRGWCRCRPRTARRSSARFEQGAEKAQPWEDAPTIADGLRVPRAIGDFLILRAVRESGGTALAVTDRAMVDGMLAIGRHDGVSAAPEGGAALAADRAAGRRRLDQAARIGRAVQHRRRAQVLST